MMKKRIVALFLILVLSVSTLSIANATSLSIDNPLDNQTQPTTRYLISLSENVGIFENDQSVNKNKNIQETTRIRNRAAILFFIMPKLCVNCLYGARILTRKLGS